MSLDARKYSTTIRLMEPAREATIPLDAEGVSCEEWGIRVQHPNGAVSHLPPETELSEGHLQALRESADLAVRAHQHYSGDSAV